MGSGTQGLKGLCMWGGEGLKACVGGGLKAEGEMVPKELKAGWGAGGYGTQEVKVSGWGKDMAHKGLKTRVWWGGSRLREMATKELSGR